MAGHIVTLICEGSCNPTIGVVDRLVQDAIIEAKGQPPVGNARLWELQREQKRSEVIRLLSGFGVMAGLALALIFWSKFVIACGAWLCWSFI